MVRRISSPRSAVVAVLACLALLGCSRVEEREVQSGKWLSATLLEDDRTMIATARLLLVDVRGSGDNSGMWSGEREIVEILREVGVVLRIDTETGKVEELLRFEPGWDDAEPSLGICGTIGSLVKLSLTKQPRRSSSISAKEWAVLDLEKMELRPKVVRGDRSAEAAQNGLRLWETFEYEDSAGRGLYRCSRVDHGPPSSTFLRTADGQWHELEPRSNLVADLDGVIWLRRFETHIRTGPDGVETEQEVSIVRYDLDTLERTVVDAIPEHGCRWTEPTGFDVKFTGNGRTVKFHGAEHLQVSLDELPIDDPGGQPLRWED